MLLSTLKITDEIIGHYRPDTSDLYVLDEVVSRRIYRRSRLNFDVERGEHWLDLGANIGAFALYCAFRQATAVCYEPDEENFWVLQTNLYGGSTAVNAAVTTQHAATLPFWRGRQAGNHSKYTSVATSSLSRHAKMELPNVHATVLLDQQFHGVKMDIEGSEGPLIDEWLIPKCDKLVMEYHTSRDKSIENLARRLEILRSKFKTVNYPPEYDRIIKAGFNSSYEGNQVTFFDRMIFCMGTK